MKLTQKQAIDAYRVVRKLENQDMPSEYAMALFHARKALEPQFQFQNEQEQNMLRTLGCQVGDIGEIQFPSDEAREKYIAKMEEIGDLEVDIKLKKETIGVKGLVLSAKDLESLDFIAKIVC